MTRQAHYITDYLPKILIVGVQAPYNTTPNIDSYFQEFRNLVKTNGITPEHELYMQLRSIDSSYFFTKGKLEELKAYCDEHHIEEVIISDTLSALQERNLSDILDCRVYDRTQLILEIFEKGAHSAEGKAQVSIAMFQHLKTRMAGKGINYAQQSGVRGFRGGFGETAKEKEKRHLEKSILNLERQLDHLHKIRATQRKQRLNTGVKQLCLIGYTNAGKSTILNALTKSNVLAEDKLFATLDTTTRELYIKSSKIGLISDTVGFIQQLPPKLIDAFKSTLSELEYADLLLHVVDISDPNWESHIHVVHDILRELGVEKEMLYVFNKVDQLGIVPHPSSAIYRYQPHVVISANSKEGIQPLADYLQDWKAYQQ